MERCGKESKRSRSRPAGTNSHHLGTRVLNYDSTGIAIWENAEPKRRDEGSNSDKASEPPDSTDSLMSMQSEENSTTKQTAHAAEIT